MDGSYDRVEKEFPFVFFGLDSICVESWKIPGIVFASGIQSQSQKGIGVFLGGSGLYPVRGDTQWLSAGLFFGQPRHSGDMALWHYPVSALLRVDGDVPFLFLLDG